MNDKKEHITYSRAEIEAYLQGRMSKDDMYLLERAALQDPFLADAIEGYGFANTTVTAQHLSEIENNITHHQQPAKIVTLSKKNEWLKIAVAVLIFVGLGWVSILLMNGSAGDNKNISSNEQQQPAVTTNENHKATAATSDSNSTKQNVVIVDEKSKKQEYVSLDKNANGNGTVSVKKSDVTMGLVSEQKQMAVNTYDADKLNSQSNISRNINQPASGNQASGPSASNNANYYNANTSNNASKDIVSEHSDLKELKKNTDETKVNAAANSGTAVINLATIKVKRDSTVESIPVTGYFSKKQAVKPGTLKLSKEDSLSVPVNGWDAFNEYVEKNRAYRTITYDTTYRQVTVTNHKTGEEIVGLEFDIDKNGQPQKIKVTHSVDEQTDAKAIELLKNGPKWQASKKKSKGKVSIKL